MPIYDYECANCRRRFEVVHGVHVPGPTSCPLCGGGPVRKAISAPAVHFKGSGWAKKERRRRRAGLEEGRPTDTGKGSEEGAAATAPAKADGRGGERHVGLRQWRPSAGATAAATDDGRAC